MCASASKATHLSTAWAGMQSLQNRLSCIKSFLDTTDKNGIVMLRLLLIQPILLCAAGKKEIVTGSLDKTIALWRLEVTLLCQPMLVLSSAKAVRKMYRLKYVSSA